MQRKLHAPLTALTAHSMSVFLGVTVCIGAPEPLALEPNVSPPGSPRSMETNAAKLVRRVPVSEKACFTT